MPESHKDLTPRRIRVWVVLDHRRMRVHTITSSEDDSVAALNSLSEKYDGDSLAMSRTVGLVDV